MGGDDLDRRLGNQYYRLPGNCPSCAAGGDGPGEAPRWAWIGGLFGAFFVAVGVIVTPKLGTAATFSTVVAGQVLVSLALDQWGWIGLPVHQLSPGRLAGAALLVIGVLMVQRL